MTGRAAVGRAVLLSLSTLAMSACGAPTYHAIGLQDASIPATEVVLVGDAYFKPLKSKRRSAGANDATGLEAQVPAPDGGFELKAADGTLSVALKRWVEAEGGTLRWESPIEVPITADSRLPGPLTEAMSAVLHAMNDAGYPLTVAQVPGRKTWIVLDSPRDQPKKETK
ncbi:toxin co-regulated pilus biosynthesis Q family protein [Burkholderia multivorans]|uniref:Toxin co-regulated pilus biosynthesis Q family protein n=1 Tax=Burkholderia multivorans TaxID=87883 RepID=A0AAP2MRP4_9BURK|nr:TcpQ domain-containing protein [Burkholderia multivorans]MBU9360511.1 toxin co-regulated pilus biosynthesis Q family protein [Burkholderia multivorans]MCA8464014.1 toxin co-regulated pilus biosynthesis Q family protein [Burkholderia multivorans]